MITDKQRKAIKFIENELEIKFEGSTFEDAFKFIGNNLKHAQFCANIDKQIGMVGVSVYSSYHSKKEGKDETYTDHRDSVAELRFKRDINHGVKSVDALINLQENLIKEDLNNEEEYECY